MYISDNLKRFLKCLIFIIPIIESNNNTESVGDNGLALGAFQIHKECVQDVNRHFGTKYDHCDVFQLNVSIDIMIKYLSLGEDRYISKYGTYPEEYHFVTMWNSGIYTKFTDTLYYEKYIDRKKIENCKSN